MKKQFAAVLAFLMTVSIVLSMAVSVRAESIESRTRWTDYAFRGTDSFYNKDIVAYKAGSQAKLAVEVKNHLGSYINVTVVGVRFDWQKPTAGWYNSTQASKSNPVRLESGETLYFIVNFTVPSLTTIYSLLHDYTVYVELTDSGGTPLTWTKTREDLFGAGKQYFVVFSDNQAQAVQSSEIIDGIRVALGTPVTWSSAKAGLLWKRAMNETSIADYCYNLGDFAAAKTHYSEALSLIDQAFDAEENRGVKLEDAEIKLAEAQVKYYESLGNFYSGLSNMWTLIGVALVLFAIGYIIRGLGTLRKPVVST